MRTMHPVLAPAIGPLLCAAALALSVSSGDAAAGTCLPSFTREFDAIPVFDLTGTAEGAWNGGWEQARPQLLDYDGDGDLDLFTAEDTGKLRYFRNDGTVAAPDFRLLTDEFGGGVHDFFFTRMVDIDRDGDWDLLVQAPNFVVNDGGILREYPGAFVFTNTGTPASPVWSNLSSLPDGYFADGAGDPIPFALTAPDFVDLEGDGDPDLLLGDQSGRIILYRNTGTPSAPVFTFETAFYGGIVITPGNCAPESPPRAAPPGRHGFMLFTFHDLDLDGRPDLFVGDQFNSNVYHYRNLGGGGSPILACQSEKFFPDSTGRPAEFNEQKLVTAAGDLDNDGDLDVFLGSATESFRSFRFFRNDGTPTVPQVRYASDDYLPEYDGGLNSAPAFGDVGLYRDWLPLPGLSWAAPEFADLDGDGDVDLFVGTNRGDVRWYRNDGAGPDSIEVVDDTFGINKLIRTRVDADAVPRFLDVDGDADLDLVVGSYDYQTDPSLRYFRNDGTPTAPSFAAVTDDFQGLGTMGQRIAPAFGDVDGDGDADLVVGNFDGVLMLYRNVSTAGVPVFRDDGPLGIDVGSNAVPYLADLDGDGRVDLVVGEKGGGLNHYRNTAAVDNPSAFALTDPPADGAVDGSRSFRFDWDPSTDPATGGEVASYELRVAASPTTPREEWRVIGPLPASQADVTLNASGLRFSRDFYWTVAAGEACRSAPVPEWRHGVNSAWVETGGAVVDSALTKPDGAGQPQPEPPAMFVIPRAYPVPARGEVTVEVAVPRAGRLRVVVHDAAGRRVKVLYDGTRSAGVHAIRWDGRAVDGRLVVPGVYLVRAESNGNVATRRLVQVR
ncbi:FG-GAP-like repeat-containing protein [bacterium]|nr:FG-GAP-like repeat-containing protein [bacterium]